MFSPQSGFRSLAAVGECLAAFAASKYESRSSNRLIFITPVTHHTRDVGADNLRSRAIGGITIWSISTGRLLKSGQSFRRAVAAPPERYDEFLVPTFVCKRLPRTPEPIPDIRWA